MKSAGLIYGDELYYLDHLAVLCKILSIPLIVTDEKIEKAALHYYPKLKLVRYDPLEAAEKILSNFEIIFTCLPRPLIDEIFFFHQAILKKKLQTVWLPHGNSDKGRKTPFMEALQTEEIALVYGQQMVDFLREKEVLDKLKKTVTLGNFRYRFYQQNRSFYDHLVEKEIVNFFKEPVAKLILFAPTWQDQEQSSSFASACPILMEELPSEFGLIVKPHPNLFIQVPKLIEELSEKAKAAPNILFLNEFPPIYPLLAHIDAYIGDMSSIGYDFLTFDRPLFFLNDKSLYLRECGTLVEDCRTIYAKIKESDIRNPKRKQQYEYTFGKPKSFKALKSEIKAALCCN